MSGIDELGGFLRLLRTELGLQLSDRDAYTDLADVEGWDSLHLLRLVSLLEDETGRRIPVRQVLEARTFQQIHSLVAGGARAAAP
ncbi:acyl carrier protein [Streptomyces sp. SID13666]|uniref:phosphopantetheine-binding protein n=1 Tax=unclassified Streptomyces TaxID=2593676 RepID=UPI0013BEFB24|nr:MULTISPECIES: phosphopantetheine-binding protein [unclassified Streptomyces]NEA54857.1 acyl carrier protein [Streptomyces sp. SID13666]NEA70659.1 acyl carrier protein [Streptomyces sp. SID13588]